MKIRRRNDSLSAHRPTAESRSQWDLSTVLVTSALLGNYDSVCLLQIVFISLSRILLALNSPVDRPEV